MEKHEISEHSGSDHEKHGEDNLEERLNKEVPDPDTHLTDAERAAIVSLSDRIHWLGWILLSYTTLPLLSFTRDQT